MSAVTPANLGRLAVVTGGSSGIGKAVAADLASRGFDLLLVARDEAKLSAVAMRLSSDSDSVVSTLSADLGTEGGIGQLCAALTNAPVGVLVACAGAPYPGAFVDGHLADYRSTTTLKTSAVLEAVYAVAPAMARAGRGAILLVSSTGGLKGVPYVAVNSAAEAYVLTLGEALHHELKPHGVGVTVLMPGPTDTPAMQKLMGAPDNYPPGVMTPARVAREGLRALELGRVSHVVGVANRVMSQIPRKLATRIMGVMTRRLLTRVTPAIADN